MKGNRYRKTTHMAKEILWESPYICLPKGVKHWAKKYLARRERFRAKRMKEENE